ncbi:MAG: DIP1984 family protein [Burkholderiales bacterium]|nr:DIP1984 family protein [Burkholderiales bacterium]
MKLAEALIERKELQSRLGRLNQRLQANALVQEGDIPSEDPEVLIKNVETTIDQLTVLVDRINKTNQEVIVDGKTLSEMITKRDFMIKRISIMREFLQKASSKIDRYSRNEIIVISTVDVKPYQKLVDKLSYEARMLDAKIQYTNWNTELM